MAKMTKEMIDNIKNYGDEIVTLKDFITAVRQNVGMYIGSKGNKGYINMAREIIQNSFDELIKVDSPCDCIIISFDERSCTLIVEDNGRGIPFGNIIRIFENQHTSSNYTKKKGNYSSGLHGVGAKVTNALSKKFIVESYILGEARRVEFNDGYPWDKGEAIIPNEDNKQGTMILFQPSYDALGPIDIKWNDVYDLINLILPLSKIGAKVLFNAIDINGKEYHEVMVNEDGIMTYLINNAQSPLTKPIILSEDTGYMKMDIAFVYDLNEQNDHIIAFSNSCPTSKGTHIDGFFKGVTQFFTNYMNKVYLANSKRKKNKLIVNSSDIKTSLVAVISVSHLNPIFNGQAKEILSNEDMDPFVKNNTIKLLDKWSKNNANDFQKICKYLKDIAEIRIKSGKEKIKLNTKYDNSLTGMPSKFVAPTGKEHLEVFFCEGDSAGSGMKNYRINERQGYFPLRGKIPNAMNTSKEKFLSNAEISGMINIIGGGYGKSFNIDKVKWEKIIHACDADADGAHINTLLLRFELMYMPELIKAGRVYKAIPPLYGVKKGKKQIFLTDRVDYTEYIQALFTKTNNVSNVDGSKISKKELLKVFYTNIDYVYYMNIMSNRYAINPYLLEDLLINKSLTYNKLKKVIESKYRYLHCKNINNTIVIEGLVDGKYHTIFFNDRMIVDCDCVTKILIKNEKLAYNLNGDIVSIYGLMNAFEKSSPKNVTRFKGLGEMNGDDLFESTMSPDKRTLIQYTLEDAKNEIEQVRYLETNKNELLEGLEVSRMDILS